MEGPQPGGHLGQHVLAAQLLRGQLTPLDEAGDEAGRFLEHGRHLRPDAEPGGLLGGEPLGLAVDAQQVGVLAGEPHDVLLAAEVDPVVAVGDAALERPHAALAWAEHRRQPGDHLGQLGNRDLLVHGATLRRGDRLRAYPLGG